MSVAGALDIVPSKLRAGDPQRYCLVSLEPVLAPDGCAGQDWLIYRIALGKNEIVGYRRGDPQRVSADLETIVEALNRRRQWSVPKPT